MPPRVDRDEDAHLDALGVPDGVESSEAPFPDESADSGNSDDEGPVDRYQDLAGKEPIESPQAVTFEMKENLRDLIYRVKAIHFEGTGADKVPTAVDMRRLLQCVFADYWIPGEPHSMPGKDTVTPKIDDVTVQVGLFSKNIGATSSGLAIPSSKRDKNSSGPQAKKASKVTKRLRSHPATKHIARKSALEGAKEAHSQDREEKKPVYVGCLPGKHPGFVVFEFYDRRHRLLPAGVHDFISLHVGMQDLEKTRGLAMQRYDTFRLENVRAYNLRAAIFMARNRLTHWASGCDMTSHPRREDCDIFIPYNLMRNMKEGCSDASMKICRQNPVPELFDGMSMLWQ